jgi:hypothetical protein
MQWLTHYNGGDVGDIATQLLLNFYPGITRQLLEITDA